MRARAYQREYALFGQLREQVGAMAAPIRQAARAVAGLDALAGLADAAATGGYCAPELVDSRELHLEGARHPVVEQLLVEAVFTPNDVQLGSGTDLVVLTGPNARAKAVVAPIGLIQCWPRSAAGCRPAAPASASPIGSSPASAPWMISPPASPPSWWKWPKPPTSCTMPRHAPVLLDEIGRGCHLRRPVDRLGRERTPAADLQARTVFATHHASTTSPPSGPTWPTSRCWWRKSAMTWCPAPVSAGGANRSYGIEAARLAGVPHRGATGAQVLDQLAA